MKRGDIWTVADCKDYARKPRPVVSRDKCVKSGEVVIGESPNHSFHQAVCFGSDRKGAGCKYRSHGDDGDGDGKGKGWPSAGRMSLKRLSFLDSRRILSAGAPGRKLNDISAPRAVRPKRGVGVAFCTLEWYIDT